MNKLCINVITFSLVSCIFLTACGYRKGENKAQVNQGATVSQNDNPLENIPPIDTIIEEKKNTNEAEIINYFESMKEEVSNCLSSENVNNFKENIKRDIIDGIDLI